MIKNKIGNYVFHIPLWNSSSNGIQVLWYFAEILSEMRKVVIIPYYDNDESAKILASVAYLVDYDYKVTESDIVIYPECISKNPLEASKVCRYILAKPAMLNGQWVYYQPSDFVFYHSKVISDNENQLNLLNKSLLNLDDKYNTGAQRNGDTVSIYYGKIRSSIDHSIVRKIIQKFGKVEIITRKFPESKVELYNIIQKSSLLISLDPLSNIAYEATLFGTPVYFADTIFEVEYQNYNFKLLGFLNSKSALNFDPKLFNHNALEKEANLILKDNIHLNKGKVQSIVHKIEDHFKNDKQTDVQELIKKDGLFIEKRWGWGGVVNGSGFTSILAYHVIKKSMILYFLVKKLHSFFKVTVRFIRYFSIKNIISKFNLAFIRILNMDNDSYYLAFKKINNKSKHIYPYNEIKNKIHFSKFQKNIIRKIWSWF